MSVLVGSISASTAAAAFEALRIAPRVSASTAAKDARKVAERQRHADADEGPDETAAVINSTEVALDLMTMGQRQPQAALQQALKLYEED
ncbi:MULTISPECIES: hypothetical protein [Rhizobium]|uniref:Uncharacterized protein n=1 Tax=Rhizobium metallidurans TaxID=1265931 RepID=A0A7W6CUF8_9HYPH|nr:MULTISPECIES: hypothetical protein [Rhizobium]MBB3966631.1 hypothetical protein [Rhizobium metallidurans]